MKATAIRLLPYSFPLVTREKEAEISPQKQKTVVVNGYHVGLYYNECRYGKYTLNSLQVFGKSHSYIPFDLVFDMAMRFLGSHKLSLIEVPHSGKTATKKIYVWTVYYDADGVAVDNPFHTTRSVDEYDGVKFNKINSSDVKFF